jgi:hypothetical protein
MVACCLLGTILMSLVVLASANMKPRVLTGGSVYRMLYVYACGTALCFALCMMYV